MKDIIYFFEQLIHDICCCYSCNKNLFTEIEPDEFIFLMS